MYATCAATATPDGDETIWHGPLPACLSRAFRLSPFRYLTYEEKVPHELTRRTLALGSPADSLASAAASVVPKALTRDWSLPSQRTSSPSWMITRSGFGVSRSAF